MTTTSQDLVLVLGATGKTGGRVLSRLEALGVPVRAGSRSASPAFSWEDPAGWPAVLDGVGAVYLSYYPDVAAPGATETVRAFTARAVAAGVRRLVLLSGRGEEEAQATERAFHAAAGPAAWTVVRCSWFSQNFSESVFLDPVLSGTVALPVGAVPEPFVDVDDVADVAVAALTQDGHAGRVYECTGPRALTFAEAVAEIAAASGRPVRFDAVPLDAFTAGMAEQGAPAEEVGMIAYLFGEVLDGRNVTTTNGVREALGREPRSFGEFARGAAATGVWG